MSTKVPSLNADRLAVGVRRSMVVLAARARDTHAVRVRHPTDFTSRESLTGSCRETPGALARSQCIVTSWRMGRKRWSVTDGWEGLRD